jgi:hypothetical protein
MTLHDRPALGWNALIPAGAVFGELLFQGLHWSPIDRSLSDDSRCLQQCPDLRPRIPADLEQRIRAALNDRKHTGEGVRGIALVVTLV